METGPALWLILLTLGVVLLGAAMAYGVMKNRKRGPVERAATDAATRREYDREDKDHS